MLADAVTSEHIAEVISKNTGIPVTKISGGEQAKQLLNLENDLRTKVVGQDHVLEAVSNCVRLSRTNLQSECTNKSNRADLLCCRALWDVMSGRSTSPLSLSPARTTQ